MNAINNFGFTEEIVRLGFGKVQWQVNAEMSWTNNLPLARWPEDDLHLCGMASWYAINTYDVHQPMPSVHLNLHSNFLSLNTFNNWNRRIPWLEHNYTTDPLPHDLWQWPRIAENPRESGGIWWMFGVGDKHQPFTVLIHLRLSPKGHRPPDSSPFHFHSFHFHIRISFLFLHFFSLLFFPFQCKKTFKFICIILHDAIALLCSIASVALSICLLWKSYSIGKNLLSFFITISSFTFDGGLIFRFWRAPS